MIIPAMNVNRAHHEKDIINNHTVNYICECELYVLSESNKVCTVKSACHVLKFNDLWLHETCVFYYPFHLLGK